MNNLMKGRRSSPKKKKRLALEYIDGPVEVEALLPPKVGTLDDVARANYDMEENHGVRVMQDEAIAGNCIELTEAAELNFDGLSSRMRFMTLFIKNINRFCEIQLEILQTDGCTVVFIMSNNQSVTRIDRDPDKGGGTCTLPMILKPGWNYLNIDLETLLSSAFGTEFDKCTSVTVIADCRVSRLFFQKRAYADIELPDNIRLAL